MTISFTIFTFFITAFAALIQVTLVPISIGLVLILTWFWKNGTKGVILTISSFSLFLGSISPLEIWVVMLATTLGLLIFLTLKSTLPSRLLTYWISLILAIIAWEIMIVLFSRFQIREGQEKNSVLLSV